MLSYLALASADVLPHNQRSLRRTDTPTYHAKVLQSSIRVVREKGLRHEVADRAIHKHWREAEALHQVCDSTQPLQSAEQDVEVSCIQRDQPTLAEY